MSLYSVWRQWQLPKDFKWEEQHDGICPKYIKFNHSEIHNPLTLLQSHPDVTIVSWFLSEPLPIFSLLLIQSTPYTFQSSLSKVQSCYSLALSLKMETLPNFSHTFCRQSPSSYLNLWPTWLLLLLQHAMLFHVFSIIVFIPNASDTLLHCLAHGFLLLFQNPDYRYLFYKICPHLPRHLLLCANFILCTSFY